MSPIVSISRLAAMTGVTPRALRHYEACDLLRPARTRTGGRRYSADQVAIAQTIVLLRSLGLSIPAIRELTDDRRPSVDAKADLRVALMKRAGELKQSYDTVLATLAILTDPENCAPTAPG